MTCYADLIEFLINHSDTITVLTPNRRLSATLHKLYQTTQINQQNKSWQTPDILPLSSWIKRLFSDYTSKTFTPSPLLLNTTQEQFLWEAILSETVENRQLLQLSETADIVKSAWALLKQWQVDIHHPIFKSTEDYAALQHWVLQFETRCQRHQWLDVASLPSFILEKMKAQHIPLPSHLILVGFTELSPQIKTLLSFCEMSGSIVNEISLKESAADLQASKKCRLKLSNVENEILIMARWAKTIFDQHPKATIGCVIPLLDKIRPRVLQIFSQVFADAKTYTVPSEACPFNISAGKSLLHYPVIYAALQWLSLPHKKIISIETFNYLLASPFIGHAESERIRRCLFDRLLRQRNINHVNLAALVKKDDETLFSFTKYCPQLAKRLRQFLSLLEENRQLLSYQNWATLFTQLLTTLGWPGERSLNSEEYQVVESWLKLLAEYTSLDQVTTHVSYQQALKTLRKMASNMLFQPQTPEASIQVLGVLEAAGLPFDYLWIAGMDDLSWPPQPKPNPFIPKSLQRQLHMPHATTERELMFCQTLIQQFKDCAQYLLFSHVEKKEELELQVSHLIRELPEINSEDLCLNPYQTPSERIYHTKQLKTILDERAPPFTVDESIRGGVNVIKQQAACPFKAFAEWRLHAHELESPLPGLRSKDRGTLLHKVLEIIWNKLKDHHTLMMMAEDALHELIHSAISHTFTSTSHARNEYKQYMSLEKKRLQKLIWDWLQTEKKRPSFKVLTNEKIAEITLNKLKFSIRIDRIDELSDGKKLIIDYKTNKYNEIDAWFSGRPEEPQLPLYALLDAEQTMGITFAQITSGENHFKGVSQYTLDIKGIKLLNEIKQTTALSWQDQLNAWHHTLTTLSDQFSQGVADVDPKDPQKTCLWCKLKPLCRINEENQIHYDV